MGREEFGGESVGIEELLNRRGREC